MPAGALAAGVAALAVALALTRVLSGPGAPLGVLDHPNERSLHTRPVPRTGGIAILAGVAAGLLAGGGIGGAGLELAWVLGCAACIAGVSLWDDVRGLSPGLRLLVHLAAGGAVVVAGLAPGRLAMPGLEWAWPAWAGAGFAVLFATWMLNLYNFMDGMDGFAGGMTVVGFATLAALGGLAGDPGFAVVALVVAAAAGGFLVFNFPPARIFMGDVGSSSLGFLAAALSLWGARDGLFPLWAAVLVFSPFVVDASVTLLRRLVAGERVWRPHRAHYYQRLVRLGWGHRKTVLAEYLLMLGCAFSALVAVRSAAPVQWTVLVAWAAGYALLARAVGRLERRAAAAEAAP